MRDSTDAADVDISPGLAGGKNTCRKDMGAGTTVTGLGTASYVLIALSIALLVVFYIPTFKRWWGEWMDMRGYYSHGVLIPLISGLIVYLKRQELRSIPLRPCALGWLLLVPCLAIALLGSLGDARALAGLMLPAIVGGMVLVLFGREMFLQLLFPIAYLYFMCVLPSFILDAASFKMRLLSTTVATWVLKLFGLTVWQEGTIISTPYITANIEEECSGLRTLITFVALSTLYVYLIQGRMWGRLALLAMAVPLSLLVNSLRVTMITLVGDAMGHEAMSRFHDYSGYLAILLGFVMIVLLGRLLGCRRFNQMLFY